MGLLKDAWNVADRNLAVEGVDEVQRTQLRRVFFSGASTAIQILNTLENSPLSGEAQAQLKELMQAEATQFEEEERNRPDSEKHIW